MKIYSYRMVLLITIILSLAFIIPSLVAPASCAVSSESSILWKVKGTDNAQLWADSGDLTGDLLPDLAVINNHWPSGPSTLQVLRNDGFPLWETVIEVASSWGVAIEDIDLNGFGEVFVYGVTNNNGHQVMYCYDHLGIQLWEYHDYHNAPNSQIKIAGFQNLDSDPELEIICGGLGWGDYSWYALDADGSELWRFIAPSIGSDLHFGDVNDDGQIEIIVYTFGDIFVLDKQGNIINTINLQNKNVYDWGAIGDVTGDSIPDIVAACGSYDSSSFQNTLYVFKNDGSILWQKDYVKSSLGKTSNPCLIDLNNDGIKDILLPTEGKVYAYLNDGSLLWTFGDFHPGQYNMIVSFDILPCLPNEEILIQCKDEKTIYILNITGDLIQKFINPNEGEWTCSYHVDSEMHVSNRYYEYADFNGDGLFDLVFDEIIDGEHYLVIRTMVEASECDPLPPKNLQTHSLGWEDISSIKLTWDPPDNVNQLPVIEYFIYRSETIDGEGVNIGSTSNIRTYVDNEVSRFYYYWVTAYTSLGESEKSNIIKAYSYQSVKGIENLVKINKLNYLDVVGQNKISIQQNFEVMIGNDYRKRYWAQNIILITDNGKIMNGCFEIYKYPYSSLLPIIVENRVVFWQDTVSDNYPFQNEVILRSHIENNKLIMENNFGDFTFELDTSFTISSDDESFIVAASFTDWGDEILNTGSPEFVIAGSHLFKTAEFLDTTQGDVDSYIKIGEGDGMWFPGINRIIPFNAHTEETSINLDWGDDGSFQYRKDAVEQGFWSKPNMMSEPDTPPDILRPEKNDALFIQAQCPVHLSLTDINGRHVGYRQDGYIDLEIPLSNYLFDNDTKLIIINDFEEEYNLSVIGLNVGEYELEVTQKISDDVVKIIWSKKSIKENEEIKYRLNIVDAHDVEVKSHPSITGNRSIRIYVKTQNGHPISGSLVTSITQPTGQLTLEMIASSNGSVIFQNVKEGFYEFLASSEGYQSNRVNLTSTKEMQIEKTILLEVEQSITEDEDKFKIPGFPLESLILGIIFIIFFLCALARARAQMYDIIH